MAARRVAQGTRCLVVSWTVGTHSGPTPGRLGLAGVFQVVVVAVAAILALSSLAGWVAFLLFCRWLVRQSRDPASLRDAAAVAKAFRASGPAAVAQGLARLAGLLRRSPGPWRCASCLVSGEVRVSALQARLRGVCLAV